MSRANVGIRIVMNERQRERQTKSQVQQPIDSKKDLLLNKLQQICLKLDHINDQQFRENQDPYQQDLILEELESLAKEAAKHELRQIQKLCKLAMGRRILNIELKKKMLEHDSKLEKREKVEMFFRENRIKKFQYAELIAAKLKQHTLIAKAYPNAKGFVESTLHYGEDYERALAESNFLKVVKCVNQLFYRNYSNLNKVPPSVSQNLLSWLWFPFAIFICLALTFPFTSFQYEQILLMTLVGAMLCVLFFLSLRTFLDRPNNKNYIQQTVEGVQAYFQKLNQQNLDSGLNIQWSCDKEFMYLEVIFHDGLSQ